MLTGYNSEQATFRNKVLASRIRLLRCAYIQYKKNTARESKFPTKSTVKNCHFLRIVAFYELSPVTNVACYEVAPVKNCRLLRIVAFYEVSPFTNCRLLRSVAFYELLHVTNCRLLRTVASRQYVPNLETMTLLPNIPII